MHKTLSRPSPINWVGNPHEGRFSINQDVPIYKKKKVKGLIKFQMERGRDDNMYWVNITPSTLNEDWKIVKPSKFLTLESQRVGVPFEKQSPRKGTVDLKKLNQHDSIVYENVWAFKNGQYWQHATKMGTRRHSTGILPSFMEVSQFTYLVQSQQIDSHILEF